MSCFSNPVEHRDNFTSDLLGISLINEETVERIIDTRITQQNQRLYKVRWKDSWLLEDQLKEHCCELIKRFCRYPPNMHQDANYHLPCFGRTFSNAPPVVNNTVNSGDMFTELVFSEENDETQQHQLQQQQHHQQQHQQQHQHLMQQITLPQKDKHIVRPSQVTQHATHHLSHMYSQDISQNPVVTGNINVVEGNSAQNICLQDPPPTIIVSAMSEAQEINQTHEVEDDVEQIEEDPDGEGCTYYSDYNDLSKLCSECSLSFQTKCNHCSLCRKCRSKSKNHWYECHGDKVCAICEHCFSGTTCKICCPYCGQVYPTSLHWKRHVRVTHMGFDKPEHKKKRSAKPRIDNEGKPIQPKDKTSKCNTCGKTFPNPHKLKRHEKIHSDVKEFQCQVCNKEFVQKVHLQKHLLQHGIGEKRFKCHNCDKWFNHKVSLKTHAPKCKSSA